MESYVTMRIIATSVENILHKSVMRKVELSPLWLVLFCVAISGFIAVKFRPLASVLVICLFGVVVLAVNSLFYDRANLLIEITYPLLSILMAMFIFPALSFVHHLGEN